MSPTDNAPQRAPMCVMFTCQDVQQSLRFYRDVLGFQLDECWPSEEQAAWCSLSLHGQVVMLGAATTGECGDADHGGGHGGGTPDAAKQWMIDAIHQLQDHPAGVGAFVYIQVDDVDAYHDTVRQRGGAPAFAPKTEFYGLRDFAIADPSGYHLIFFAPIAMEASES